MTKVKVSAPKPPKEQPSKASRVDRFTWYPQDVVVVEKDETPTDS